jgi:Big-like domain-containing protein
MVRLTRAAATMAAVSMLASCAGNSDMSPSSPTPTPSPSATVTAVAVTSPTVTGSTFQLMATARLSDGSTRDVTAISSWTTSNPLIAAVSVTGLVTVVGSGNVELRATYQNVVGMLAMQMAPGFLLAGTVQEVGPETRAVSDVRVEIVSGPGAGTVVTSDSTGLFRFSRLTGLVAIEATKTGYLPWRLANLTVDHDMTLQVGLYPTPPTNASGATATARCTDGTWSWATTVAEACTANGGILYGVCPGALCAATRSIGVIR